MAGKEYRLTILVSGHDTGAKSMLGGVGNALSSIGNIAGGILGANLFLALANQVKEFAMQGLHATAEYESMALAMESMIARELRNRDATLSMADALDAASGRSKELLDWVQQLAIQSPFDAQGVQDAFQTALAYGFVSDEAQRLTQNMIDYAAGSGRGVDVMNRIALALGQVKAKGKLAGQEILQLVNAGVPVNDILKKMGYTLDDVSAGLVKADEFLEAVNKTMEEDFGGAAKRATNSWNGLLNSLGDIKKIGLRTLFADTLEVLQPLVSEFTLWLQGEGLAKLEQMGKSMGKFTQSVVDMFSSFKGKSAGEIFVELSKSFSDWADSINWEKVSTDLAEGINSIDWALLGEQTNEGFSNIFSGIYTAVSEIDWWAIGESLGTGLAEFLAGITGQGSLDNVINTWISNIMLAFQIQLQLGAIGKQKADEFRAGMIAGLAATPAAIIGQIITWVGLIQPTLDLIKKQFFNTFFTAGQQAIRGLEAIRSSVMAAMVNFIAAVKSVIKAIVIPVTVSLPNFGALAAKVAAGVALLDAAASGNKGGKSWSGRGFADGGISRGPLSGHMELLHGTEAVIPLKNGSIPVSMGGSLNPSAVGGGMNINVMFNYSPTVSTASRFEANDVIGPMVADVIRGEFTKRGM